MFQELLSAALTGLPYRPGNRHFYKKDGLHEAGRFKNSLHQQLLTFYRQTGSRSATRSIQSDTSTRSQEFLPKNYKKTLFLSLVLGNECHGQQIENLDVNKTRCTRF